MDKTSELECYLYFMWNAWSKQACKEIFSESCYEHLWLKWMDLAQSDGMIGAAASWYAALDDNKRHIIREAAVNHYNKEG